MSRPNRGSDVIELCQLRYFVTVIGHGNFSAAARALGISQPVLTRVIARLERRLGASLVLRNSHGVLLTSEGRRFAAYAELILSDCARAAQEVHAVSAGDLGNVSLGIASSYTGGLLQEIIARVLAELPSASLEIVEGAVDQLLPEVLQGRVDFMLGTFSVGSISTDIVMEPLLKTSPVLVTGEAHPFVRRRQLSPEDLVGAEWATMDSPFSLDVMTEFITHHGLPRPRAVQTNSLGLLKDLLSTGRYVALLTRRAVHQELRTGVIKRLKIEIPDRRPSGGLIYLRRHTRSIAVSQAIQIAREVCRKYAESSRTPLPMRME